MSKYEFRLNKAYCLFNGVAISRQHGSVISVLVEREDEFLKAQIVSSFFKFVDYVKKQPDCPDSFFKVPCVYFIKTDRKIVKERISFSKTGSSVAKKVAALLFIFTFTPFLFWPKDRTYVPILTAQNVALEINEENSFINFDVINNTDSTITGFEIYFFICDEDGNIITLMQNYITHYYECSIEPFGEKSFCIQILKYISTEDLENTNFSVDYIGFRKIKVFID